MAFNLDLDSLQDQLFDAAKEVSDKYIKEIKSDTEDLYDQYQKDLREYTDNLSVLKKEIAEAEDDEIKKVKLESIRLQERAIDSLVDRYQMLFNVQAAEKLKEALKAVGLTAGKIALSLALAAVLVDSFVEIPDEKIMEKLNDDSPVLAESVAEEAVAKITMAALESKVAELEELYSDGFQVSDIFQTITSLMETAELFDDSTGEEKKQFVVEGFRMLYERLDPDISSWIPQWIENKVVNYAINSLLPQGIDWAVSISKGDVKVNN